MNEQIPQYTINSQIETMQPDVTGRFVTGTKITFTTPAGDTASVFLRDSEYTVENAVQAISQKVRMLNGVRSVQQ